MIKSITVTNYLGDSIKLELTRPDLSGFIVKPITGLGPVKASIKTTKVASDDGERYNSSTRDKRNIVLNLEFMMTATETIEDIRHKSYKYFPLSKSVKLRIENDNRIVETEGYVESNEPDIFSANESASISIICPDPYLYATKNQYTSFGDVIPMFEFPMENASLTQPLIEFARVERLSERNIYYEGDVEAGITIMMYTTGTIESDITILNTLTKEEMTINTAKIAQIVGDTTNKGLINGDVITISTSKRNKRSVTLVRNAQTYNILNCLPKGTPWFQLAKGDNLFTYTTSDSNESLYITFHVYNKVIYDGV